MPLLRRVARNTFLSQEISHLVQAMFEQGYVEAAKQFTLSAGMRHDSTDSTAAARPVSTRLGVASGGPGVELPGTLAGPFLFSVHGKGAKLQAFRITSLVRSPPA